MTINQQRTWHVLILLQIEDELETSVVPNCADTKLFLLVPIENEATPKISEDDFESIRITLLTGKLTSGKNHGDEKDKWTNGQFAITISRHT